MCQYRDCFPCRLTLCRSRAQRKAHCQMQLLIVIIGTVACRNTIAVAPFAAGAAPGSSGRSGGRDEPEGCVSSTFPRAAASWQRRSVISASLSVLARRPLGSQRDYTNVTQRDLGGATRPLWRAGRSPKAGRMACTGAYRNQGRVRHWPQKESRQMLDSTRLPRPWVYTGRNARSSPGASWDSGGGARWIGGAGAAKERPLHRSGSCAPVEWVSAASPCSVALPLS